MKMGAYAKISYMVEVCAQIKHLQLLCKRELSIMEEIVTRYIATYEMLCPRSTERRIDNKSAKEDILSNLASRVKHWRECLSLKKIINWFEENALWYFFVRSSIIENKGTSKMVLTNCEAKKMVIQLKLDFNIFPDRKWGLCVTLAKLIKKYMRKWT